MAEDKKLQAGIAGFLNKKTTNKAPRQKVVEKKTAPQKETSSKAEELEAVSNKATKKATEGAKKAAKAVLEENVSHTSTKRRKASEELKKATISKAAPERKNPGPKSNKIEGIPYKQISARVPEVLKDKLKQSLYGPLFKQYTQDEFIEQAIIDFMKKHGIKPPKY